MEPERRIEKWLRAFAKKRREQAGDPVELHPATRQRLQREIARSSEEKSHGGFFSFFFGLRPKLAFAVCFITLAIGGWFLLPQLTGPQPAQLSMNKDSYPETPPSAAAPAMTPPPVTSPAVAGEDKKVAAEKQKFAPAAPQPARPTVASADRTLRVRSDTPQERDRAESAVAQKQLIPGTPASAPPTNLNYAFKNETAADSLSLASTVTKDTEVASRSASLPQGSNFIAGRATFDASAQTQQTTFALQRAAAMPASTNTAPFDLAKATGSATVSQVFKRLDASSTRRAIAGVSGTPAPVLTSFRVEQNGNDMKVVDLADGTVYTGAVQIAQQEPPAATTFAAAKNAPTGSSQLAKTTSPAQQNYFFRVAGTNRNLKQNVTFSGNFVPLTNSQLATEAVGARSFGGMGGGGGGGDQTISQPIQAVLSNSKIDGNVVIGDQKAIDVIATPAP